jgi:hypothetical protein
MPEQTTYLVTAADTLLGYTTILLLSHRAATNSFVQPLHINPTFTLKNAADTVAAKWQKTIDVVIACPDGNVDPRILMSVFMPVLEGEAKVLVLRKKVEDWCRDFVLQMHKGSGIVGVGIEVGDVREVEMKERMAWVLGVMDRASKKKGSGSVVSWG